MSNMKLLEINNLNKSFDNKEILKDINLSIQHGKIIGLLGKNGVGKTTLIKLINDLLTPTSGEILIKGQKIGVETKKVISYLPERTYLNKQIRRRQDSNLRTVLTARCFQDIRFKPTQPLLQKVLDVDRT